MTTGRIEGCIHALQRSLGARVFTDEARLEPYASDFGGVVHRRPAAVVQVRSAEEVVFALQVAANHETPIATRGRGHSVSGQSLAASGVVLDLQALDAVAVSPNDQTASAGAGALWHSVASQAFSHGLFPVAPTMIADVTVGGTLSVGGIGARSFCEGIQADRVLELEVATLHGQLVRCSATENRALYDAMRAGLGQCGVITRARYPLRPAKPRIRSYSFAYHAYEPWLTDLLSCSRDRRADFVFGGLSWSEGRWQCVLMLGQEFSEGAEVDDAAMRAGLRYSAELPAREDPVMAPDGLPGHRFFKVERGNHGSGAHPWTDHICAPDAAARLIDELVSRPPIAPRAGITIGVGCIASQSDLAPLFMRPPSEFAVLISMLSEVPDGQLSAPLEQLRAHSARGQALGGKRYVYGFFDGWNAADWAEHYGAERWTAFVQAKDEYDPHRLLNPGCITWPSV